MASARLRLESLEAREVPATLGTLDTTFGDGGKLVLPGDAAIFPLGSESISQDAQGRMLSLGLPNGNLAAQPTLLRLTPDGMPDATFGTGGSVPLTRNMVDSGPDTLSHNLINSPISVAADSLGRVYVVGRVGWETGQLAVSRLTATGALDTTFGSGGTVLISRPDGYASLPPAD